MFCCCLFIDPTLYPTFPSLQEYFQNSRFWLAWLSSHNDGGVIVHVLPCFRLHMFQLRESPPPSTPCSCVLQARLTGAITGSIADICQHFLSFQKIKKHGQVRISIIYMYMYMYAYIHISTYVNDISIYVCMYVSMYVLWIASCSMAARPSTTGDQTAHRPASRRLNIPRRCRHESRAHDICDISGAAASQQYQLNRLGLRCGNWEKIG